MNNLRLLVRAWRRESFEARIARDLASGFLDLARFRCLLCGVPIPRNLEFEHFCFCRNRPDQPSLLHDFWDSPVGMAVTGKRDSHTR